jgi:hypothetical protein
MVRITGYAKRPEPKWPYMLLFIAGIFLFFSVISLVTLASNLLQKKEATVVDKTVEVIELKPNKPQVVPSTLSALAVERMVFASEITEQNQPGNELQEISKSRNQKVYCYTRIQSAAVPKSIHHLWIDPQGQVLADIKIDVLNQPGNIWSYISLADKKTGVWTVEIKNAENKLLDSRHLTISE